MSFIGNALHDIGSVASPLAKAVPFGGIPAAIYEGIQGKGSKVPGDLLSAIPGVGLAEDVSGLAKGVGGGGSGNQSDALTNSLLQTVKGLTYGQETGSDASSLAKDIFDQLQNLSPADAQKVLSAIPQSALGTDISNLANPSTTANQSPYGFDPLSMGLMFSQTLAPWLKQQQGLANTGIENYGSQMQSALKGASPQLQAAYKVSVPAEQQAQSTENQAISSATATAPEWDALVSGITNATNAAKLAQAAAQAEPYWAATTGTGALPTSGAASSAQNTVNSIMQQVLQGQAAQTH